jgi:hypothetical protein
MSVSSYFHHPELRDIIKYIIAKCHIVRIRLSLTCSYLYALLKHCNDAELAQSLGYLMNKPSRPLRRDFMIPFDGPFLQHRPWIFTTGKFNVSVGSPLVDRNHICIRVELPCANEEDMRDIMFKKRKTTLTSSHILDRLCACGQAHNGEELTIPKWHDAGAPFKLSNPFAQIIYRRDCNKKKRPRYLDAPRVASEDLF